MRLHLKSVFRRTVYLLCSCILLYLAMSLRRWYQFEDNVRMEPNEKQRLRQSRLEHYCRVEPNIKSALDTSYMFVDDKHKIILCLPDRIAGVTVRKIWHLITSDQRRPLYTDPLTMDSHLYRNTIWPTVTDFDLKEKQKTYYKFLLVGSPLQRLWSAYLDYLYLPRWWGQKAKRFRRSVSNPPTGRDVCASDVTYEQFLRHIVYTKQFGPARHFPMVTPIAGICDPCRIKYHRIGKLETFTEDITTILADLNATEKVDMRGLTMRSRVIKDIVNYTVTRTLTFDMAKLSNKPRISGNKTATCRNKTKIVQRLWESFKLRGFLPKTADLPANVTAGTVSNIYGYFEEIFDAWESSGFAEPSGKEKADFIRAQAWMSLDPVVFNLLLRKYHDDINMFGYTRSSVPDS